MRTGKPGFLTDDQQQARAVAEPVAVTPDLFRGPGKPGERGGRPVSAPCVLTLAGPAEGQRPPQKLTCTFDRYASLKAGTLSKTKKMRLEFTVDTTTPKAYMVGNNGVAEVHMVSGPSGMTFLEVLVTGAVQSTTLDKSGNAVHSRHTMIADDLMPSQYYGICR